MSVRVISWVWDNSQAEGSELLVLLAIADSADDDGTNAWPAISTVAKRARISERSAQRAIKRLAESGELSVETQAGGNESTRADRRPNRYTIHIERGDRLTPRSPNGVTPVVERGDTAMSPNPSLDPSLEVRTTSRTRRQADEIRAPWPEELEPIRTELEQLTPALPEKLQALVRREFFDPDYWRTIDALTDGTGVFYDRLLRRYLTWQANAPPSRRHRALKRGFSEWVKSEIHRDTERQNGRRNAGRR